MGTPDTTRRLLLQVAQRERWSRIGHATALGAVWGGGLAGAVVLSTRLTGWRAGLPAGYEYWLIGAPLLVGLGWAGWRGIRLWHSGRIGATWAAKRVDQVLATPDLFTTVSQLDTAPGAYQTVVRQQADVVAATADPVRIRPFAPGRELLLSAGSVAVLAALVLTVPQLDPFGAVRQQARQDQRHAELKKQVLATKERLAQLAQAKVDEPVSTQTQAELNKLMQTLAKLQPGPPKANATALSTATQDLAQKLATMPPAITPEDAQQAQQLGGENQQSKAMREALGKGDDARISREMEAMKDLAEKAKSKDPVAAQAAKEELRRKLESVSHALGKQGKSAQAAIQQAMDQLAQSNDAAGSQAAMDAMQDSLELAQQEMRGLGQNSRDRAAMKEAMQTMRLARMADAQGKLGEGKGECTSMAEYAARFAQSTGNGTKPGSSGKGMGRNKGQGEGGQAHENDNALTDFTGERSPSQMTAGETIMSWKTKGDSETGVAREAYQAATMQARQEASDALEHEQLPPEQQAAVKRYFDGLAADAATGAAAGPPGAKPAVPAAAPAPTTDVP